MSAWWLLPLAAVVISLVFLGRSLARVSKAVLELRQAMTGLAEASNSLQQLRSEMADLGDAVEERRRQ